MKDMPDSLSGDPSMAEYAEQEVESVMNSYSVVNARHLKKVGRKLKRTFLNSSMPETTKNTKSKALKLPDISRNNTLDQITSPAVTNFKASPHPLKHQQQEKLKAYKRKHSQEHEIGRSSRAFTNHKMEMSRRKFNNSIAYNPISHKTQAIDDKPMNPLNSVHNLLDPSSGVDQWTELIKFNAQQEALEHEKRRADKLKQ